MEDDDPHNALSIGDLADRAGVSRRTVRYYVQRNLIDPPDGRGRGSAYSGKHVEQISRIVRLQREGMALDDIQGIGEDAPVLKTSPHGRPELVMRVPIAPGIRLELDAGESLPTPDVLDKLAAACEKILRR